MSRAEGAPPQGSPPWASVARQCSLEVVAVFARRAIDAVATGLQPAKVAKGRRLLRPAAGER
eukprot:4532657-Prymnesium_polylepis.1